MPRKTKKEITNQWADNEVKNGRMLPIETYYSPQAKSAENLFHENPLGKRKRLDEEEVDIEQTVQKVIEIVDITTLP